MGDDGIDPTLIECYQTPHPQPHPTLTPSTFFLQPQIHMKFKTYFYLSKDRGGKMHLKMFSNSDEEQVPVDLVLPFEI